MENISHPPFLSPSTIKLVEEAMAIEAEEAKAAGALGFMARMLVQATMPTAIRVPLPHGGAETGHSAW